MTDAIRYAQYVTLRNNMEVEARVVGRWLRHQNDKRVWLHEDEVTCEKQAEVPVPGIGRLRFQIEYDNDHNEWDGDNIEYKWRSRETCDNVRTGKSLGDGWYAINEWDGQRFLSVSFPGGGDYATRRGYYSSTGMSRGEADLRARQAIRKECEYWQSVHRGDVSFVGWIVTLYDHDDKEIGHDSCWGYTYDDTKYIHDEMDSNAQALVEAQFQLLHGLDIDDTHMDEAWRAWTAAMVSSDDDREIADPVFISTLREKACQASLSL